MVSISNIIHYMQNGLTALHYAAGQGHLSAMRTLVKEFKLDPDVVDKVSIVCMSASLCLFVYSQLNYCLLDEHASTFFCLQLCLLSMSIVQSGLFSAA